MLGILRIAYKLLVNDRAKFAALLVGITFAVFLMIQMTSLFSGVLNRSSATVINIGAKMWVMDPAVQTVANSIPLPDFVLDEVRSIPGVKFAVPLYSGAALAKLVDGTYQSVSVMGLDDSSLFGRPELLQGNIEDIYAENGFIVIDDAEMPKLENPKIGTVFELNEHKGVIVGIGKVASSGLFGTPTLYTTYFRALQYIPNTAFTISYILVEPKTENDIKPIELAVKKMGYLAVTKDQFMDKISYFYKYKTGLGTSMLLMTVISFSVGLSRGEPEIDRPRTQRVDDFRGNCVLDDEADRRVGLTKARNGLSEPSGRERRQRGDADRAAASLGVFERVVERDVDLADEAAQRRHEVGADPRQRDAAWIAIEQLCAERQFEIADLHGQGRLRQVQPLRGAGKTALFGKREAGAQLGERIAHKFKL